MQILLKLFFFFEQVDALLTPTTSGAAFGIDERPSDPVTMYLNDIYTVTVNLAGLPAISIPAGITNEGLPLGLQIMGLLLSEQLIFNIGSFIEHAANFRQYKQFNN